MELYITNLLRENSVTTISIVRDDASSSTYELRDQMPSDEHDGQWTSSSSLESSDQAPTLPTRLGSNPSLFNVLKDRPTSRKDPCPSPEVLSLFEKFHDLNQKYQRKSKKAVFASSHKTEQHYHYSCGLNTKAPQMNYRWEDARATPKSQLLQGSDPPSLPLRRRSDENLAMSESAKIKSRPRRGNSLDYSTLPSAGRQQRCLKLSEHKKRTKKTIPNQILLQPAANRVYG